MMDEIKITFVGNLKFEDLSQYEIMCEVSKLMMAIAKIMPDVEVVNIVEIYGDSGLSPQ